MYTLFSLRYTYTFGNLALQILSVYMYMLQSYIYDYSICYSHIFMTIVDLLIIQTFMWNHENNERSLSSTQWLCGNSCILGSGILTSCIQVHELPQSYCGDNEEGT